MHCLGCLTWLNNKVAAGLGSWEEQQQAEQQLRQQACCAILDAALRKLLQASQLDNSSSNRPLPASLAGLTEQVQKAVKELQGQHAAVKQASDKLLRLHRQQQHDNTHVVRLHTICAPQPVSSPAADAWVSTAASIVFAHVALDSAAVLQRRHEQLLQLAASLGFSNCSSLSAALQPATKAIVACIVLGSHMLGGEVKLSCTVRRQTAFWDALQQLLQQGIVPSGPGGDGVVQLAKLFPRFVDEHLSAQHQQQHHQQQQPPTQRVHDADLPIASSTAELQQQPVCGSEQLLSWRNSQAAAAVEAGEGHGPRKEFFEAVAANWTATNTGQPALLVHLVESGAWWLNAALQCSPRLQQALWAMGWFIAQALTNRCTLGLPLAPLLFHLLLRDTATPFQPTLDLLQQHDPAAATSIRAVLKLPPQQYQQLLQVEQLPSSTSREHYVQLAVQQLLLTDVEWELEAVRQGFTAGTNTKVLQDCCLCGTDLAAAICGCSAADADAAEFKVQRAFRVVLEDEQEGFGDGSDSSSSSAVTLHCLWAVLDSWDVTRRKAFVKFVTGTDRLPAHPGSEQLVISFPFLAYGLKHQQQLLGTLPQSHTCSNTLELPDYAEALIATTPALQQEWAAAHSSRLKPVSAPTNQAAAGAVADVASAVPLLVQACCRVLQDRLEVAVSCTSYGLDSSS